MRIKELRKKNNLTQQQAADYIGISLRSYKSYENDPEKIDSIKYKYILAKLEELNRIDEEHGILEIDELISMCKEVFENHDVKYCYLFGSYAKNKAKESSDVDLLISTSETGLKFYALIEEVRLKLNKKVDVLDLNQLTNNLALIDEILKDGMKIYG